MTPTDFLLCLIDAFGGRVQGRTLLQKRAFFVTELIDGDFGLKFDAHFYGPYSPTVEGATTQLRNLGFVEEAGTGFGAVRDGFEVKRYDYFITDDGKMLLESLRTSLEYENIRRAAGDIIAAGDPNYLELSIAAKAYFILKRKKDGRMSVTELIRQAKDYNWNISREHVVRAAKFLKQVGLAREA